MKKVIVLFAVMALMVSSLMAGDPGFTAKVGNSYICNYSGETDLSFKADRALRLDKFYTVLYRFDSEQLKDINGACTLSGMYPDLYYGTSPVGGTVFASTVKGTWAEFSGDADVAGAAGACSYDFRSGPSTSWDGNGGNVTSVYGVSSAPGVMEDPVSVLNEIKIPISKFMVLQLKSGDYSGLAVWTSVAAAGLSKSAMLSWEGTEIAVESNGNVAKVSPLAVSPNPFNPSTVISISADLTGLNPEVAIYSVNGEMVANLQMRKSGSNYSTSWKAQNAASGVYVAKIMTTTGLVSKKLFLMK